ncbi:sensor histidine kinase [Dietzia cercidiphylli]|uniref:sensor histidine kinase n=1 Tax=Dietzia cercidiphylli TaxID=498199 RepID=UPI00223A82BA|nr:HAMP domain-containing sensor histidine kinase [Dietzia cercidiphylli]MCT1514811.1 HAMP domain-containing histidine kinase [Dietzia cercidiphylli]
MTASRFDRIPLRVLLVGTMLLLVFAGLVVSGASVALTMRAQLVERVDGQLLDAANTWAHRPPGGPESEVTPDPGLSTEPPLPDRPSRAAPPSRFYVEERTAWGSVVLSVAETDDRPELSSSPQTGTPITVPGTSGEWRVLVLPTAEGTTVVGLPLDREVDQTITLLIVLSTALGAVVLLGVGIAGWVLVTRALRPLDKVRSVAGHIAEGDLEQRLPPRPLGTEVGDLTASLNEMVDALRAALAASSTSEAQARASAERTRRFAADASHELRTPLTSIRGFAELHRMGALSDASTALERIEDESLRMSRIVEDLLTLAHMDAERPLERAPVDVADLVSTAVDAARATAPHRTVRLSIEAVPVVDADQGRLHQVVSNLLANALRHTPDEAQVRVLVGQEGTDAVITVSDDGPGMTRQDADRAFERFHRADTSRTRSEGGGSGLGLSIVDELVRAHGGTVSLTTAPGQGATFTVRLPTE